MKSKNSTSHKDIYSRITDQIVSSLEQGIKLNRPGFSEAKFFECSDPGLVDTSEL